MGKKAKPPEKPPVEGAKRFIELKEETQSEYLGAIDDYQRKLTSLHESLEGMEQVILRSVPHDVRVIRVNMHIGRSIIHVRQAMKELFDATAWARLSNETQGQPKDKQKEKKKDGKAKNK